MILEYQSGQQVIVRPLSGDCYECRGVLEDSLFGAEVILEIGVPGLDIRAAEYTIRRAFIPPSDELKANFGKLVGVRAGQGLTRIVRGLIGGPAGSDRLAALVMDTAEAIILSFTKGPLRAAMSGSGVPTPHEEDRGLNPKVMGLEHIKLMSQQNPRMKDSCIAFHITGEEDGHA